MRNKSVANENILKLRELTTQLNGTPNYDYSEVLKKLRVIIDDGKLQVDKSESPQSKIKCYENICYNITELIRDIKNV